MNDEDKDVAIASAKCVGVGVMMVVVGSGFIALLMFAGRILQNFKEWLWP